MTRIFSLVVHPAFLYFAAAEATKVIVNVVKPKSNKDKTHHGQFEYSVWINLIADTSHIIWKHGLFPKPNKYMNDIVPALNIFLDHWTDTSTDTKNCVKKLLDNTFSSNAKLLSTLGQRHIGVLGTYAEERPLSGIQLLLQAYKIKTEGQRELVLEGGKFKPCSDAPQDPRDSIHFENDSEESVTKATEFAQFSLASNNVFLNPTAVAAVIYTDKSTQDVDKQDTAKLKGLHLRWKRKNPKHHWYVKVKHLAPRKPGGTGGNAKDSNELERTQFVEPLKMLYDQCK